MASDAFERASKRLERPSEALLAEMITRDAALRQEAAAGGPYSVAPCTLGQVACNQLQSARECGARVCLRERVPTTMRNAQSMA